MAIKSTHTFLLSVPSAVSLQSYVMDLLKNHVVFEVLDPKDLEGSSNASLHPYIHEELSKSEKSLRERVVSIIDSQLALRKESPFEDTRKHITLDAFNDPHITYEQVYKLEKRIRDSKILEYTDLTTLQLYASKLEFYEKLSEILAHAFTFESKQQKDTAFYISIAVPLAYEKEVKQAAKEHGITVTEVEWTQKISLWKSNSIFTPFQKLAGDLGSVSSRDVDSTALISFFFALFFGFCLADAVYGIALTVIAGFLWFGMKAKKGVLNMSKIFFISGLFSTVIGALSGSWAGDLLSKEDGSLLVELGIENWGIFNVLRSFQVIDPINALANVPVNTYLSDISLNPIVFLLGLSIGIGLVCIISGYVLNTINLYRNGEKEEGNYASVWLLFLSSIFLAIIALLSGDGAIQPLAYGYFALCLVAVFVINSGTGIAGKFIAGFGTVWGLISFFADILSFTRLIAVGLTGGIIGSVINLLAVLLFTSIPLPLINFLLLIGLLIVGHIFNFIITLFGAYINPLRLSYVEYLPKFILGKERNMQPDTILLTYHKLNFED